MNKIDSFYVKSIEITSSILSTNTMFIFLKVTSSLLFLDIKIDLKPSFDASLIRAFIFEIGLSFPDKSIFSSKAHIFFYTFFKIAG